MEKGDKAMATYRVAVGRKTYEYLDVTVKAATKEEAATKAIFEATVRFDDPAWDSGDCDYYETGIEVL